jgi:hypothetical protein
MLLKEIPPQPQEISLAEKYYQDLDNFGLSSSNIDKKWGEQKGFHHKVILYRPPDEAPFVVKFPVESHLGIVLNLEEERRAQQLNQDYFGPFYTKTEILGDTKSYYVKTEFVDGEAVTLDTILAALPNEENGTIFTPLGHQLQEFAKRNQKLIDEKEKSADFLGFAGTMSVIYALENYTEYEPIILTNFRKQKNTDLLKLIDGDLIDLRSIRQQGLVGKISSTAMYEVNRVILKWLFKTDIGRSKRKTKNNL